MFTEAALHIYPDDDGSGEEDEDDHGAGADVSDEQSEECERSSDYSHHKQSHVIFRPIHLA
jgi:hypothetical protein